MNILSREHSVEQPATTDCNKVTIQYQVLKSIANEVFRREKEGDKTAFEILTKVFKNLEAV